MAFGETVFCKTAFGEMACGETAFGEIVFRETDFSTKLSGERYFLVKRYLAKQCLARVFRKKNAHICTFVQILRSC